MKKPNDFSTAKQAEQRTGSAGIFLTMPPESSLITPKGSMPSKRGMTSEGVGRNRYIATTHASAGLYSRGATHDEKWLRMEVEREKMKIGRFIETQERR